MLQNIGTPIIILNQDNQVLLGKRKNAYSSGFYGMPGGRVELDEKLTDAVIRELAEECNLTPLSIEYVGVARENQDKYSFVHFGFLVKKTVGSLQNNEPDKCEGWEWHNLKNLPENILPGHKAILEMFQNKSMTLIDL